MVGDLTTNALIMPGYIIHLAVAEQIIRHIEEINVLSDDWKNSFRLGNLLPDTKATREKFDSHFWNEDDIGKLAIYPDMDKFLHKYGNKLDSALMLGYYSHLLLDVYFVKDLWPSIIRPCKGDKSDAVLWDDTKYIHLVRDNEYVPEKEFFSSKYYYGDYSISNKHIFNQFNVIVPEYREADCFISEVDFLGLKAVICTIERLVSEQDFYCNKPLKVFSYDDLNDFIINKGKQISDIIIRRL